MRLLPLALIASLAVSTAFAQQFTPPSKDSSTAVSGNYVMDTSHASVLFDVTHMGLSNYRGRFNTMEATLTFDAKNPSASKLNVTIEPGSVDVHNSKLEAELVSKDFFDVQQFPRMSFTATSITKTSDTTGKMTGNLTMKGVSKPVVLDVTFNGHGINPFSNKPMLGFSAKTSFKRSDFGLDKWVPMVGDTVNVIIEAEFAKAD